MVCCLDIRTGNKIAVRLKLETITMPYVKNVEKEKEHETKGKN